MLNMAIEHNGGVQMRNTHAPARSNPPTPIRRRLHVYRKCARLRASVHAHDVTEEAPAPPATSWMNAFARPIPVSRKRRTSASVQKFSKACKICGAHAPEASLRQVTRPRLPAPAVVAATFAPLPRSNTIASRGGWSRRTT